MGRKRITIGWSNGDKIDVESFGEGAWERLMQSLDCYGHCIIDTVEGKLYINHTYIVFISCVDEEGS